MITLLSACIPEIGVLHILSKVDRATGICLCRDVNLA